MDPEDGNSCHRIITCVLVGAGHRGHGYASYALQFPESLNIVAVAEPRDFQRLREAKEHNISDENVCNDWRELSERDKFADCVIICTVDREHKAPAVAFANKGYHILLEKPMGVNEAECREIAGACKANNVKLSVCHVVRYVPWAKRIRDIISSGRIGDVVNIQHIEPIGFWHFAHSYVRGNWGNEAESSCSLLAKCCHDVDLIRNWMGDKKCTSISSFGHLTHFTKANKIGFWHFAHSFVRGNWGNEADSSCSLLAKCCHDVDLIKNWMGDKKCTLISSFGHLTHFTKANKPVGASSRCMTCPTDVEEKCAYSAKRFYINEVKFGNIGWPVCVIADVVDIESVTEALRTGPYGRCVYDCNNDVMSHQVVNFQFEGGATVSLTMVAFSKKVCAREVKVYGTKGEIIYDDQIGEMKIFDFLTSRTETEDMRSGGMGRGKGLLAGHGGGDFEVIDSFISAIKDGRPELIKVGADDTLSSHLLVFAAEKARKECCVVHVNADGSF